MLFEKCSDPDELNYALGKIDPKKELVGDFDAHDWFKDRNNIAFTDGEGSFGLFEFEQPGIYTPHVFFQIKGHAALVLGSAMLYNLFENYPVEILRGLTPVEKIAARWFSRKLGFESFGEVETIAGHCELFIMTRKQFYEKNIRTVA